MIVMNIITISLLICVIDKDLPGRLFSSIPTMPTTMAILNILDPKIFPIMKSKLFFLADSMLDASSGKLVPIAAIDNPIT